MLELFLHLCALERGPESSHVLLTCYLYFRHNWSVCAQMLQKFGVFIWLERVNKAEFRIGIQNGLLVFGTWFNVILYMDCRLFITKCRCVPWSFLILILEYFRQLTWARHLEVVSDCLVAFKALLPVQIWLGLVLSIAQLHSRHSPCNDCSNWLHCTSFSGSKLLSLSTSMSRLKAP